MEEFVKEAINQGFSAYGISSHAPLPDWVGHSNVLKRERVDDYLAEISRLKALYADKIELYAALEIDYLDDLENPANQYFQNLALDYRIGSVHFLQVKPRVVIDADTRPIDFRESLLNYYDNNLKQLILDYFDAKSRMITRGGFDFVGHADKVSMNALSVDPQITSQRWYIDRLRDYFTYIAERGMMLEINTKAFNATGLTFPNIKHFRLLKELNIPLVVNSDAHYPDLINSGRAEIIELLKTVGYQSVREFHNGAWRDETILNTTLTSKHS